jgi:hypothetical protein
MIDGIQRHAVISQDGIYRYLLTREWETPLLMSAKSCSLAFIMLNPSTADAEIDDPTIRRCMGFARREGYYGITVVNLFAMRATSPSSLRRALHTVGPKNDAYIARCLGCGDVVAAWGSNFCARYRVRDVFRLLPGVVLKCLGVNKDGSPKHPLYVPKDTPLVSWEGNL